MTEPEVKKEEGPVRDEEEMIDVDLNQDPDIVEADNKKKKKKKSHKKSKKSSSAKKSSKRRSSSRRKAQQNMRFEPSGDAKIDQLLR
jgi:hypothetical protein